MHELNESLPILTHASNLLEGLLEGIDLVIVVFLLPEGSGRS